MSWMLAGSIQEHIAQRGGARMFLHDGPDVTREFEATLELETSAGWNEYFLRMFYAAGDTLVFADERYRYSCRTREKRAQRWSSLGAGHKESMLSLPEVTRENKTADVVSSLLRQLEGYQFHNTSLTARMRSKWAVGDNRWLKEDAGNVGPFLLRLRENEPEAYQKAINLLRLILPFFHDFVLEPDYDRVLLQWREKGSDVIFDASQASDGMLRTIALVALLAQPADQLPGVIVLDEPELGLHPYAIDTIAGLIKSASRHSQVFVATQSATLIDNFEPEDIVVVERQGRESIFKRQDSKSLEGWLKDYSISELWEKNVLGGRP